MFRSGPLALSASRQSAVAHAIEQLIRHLLVGEVVEIRQDQDAHHDRSGVRRAPAPLSIPSGQQFINDLREVVKVDVRGNDLQRIAQGLDLLLARSIGEEVQLDGAARWRFGFACGDCRVARGGLGLGEVFGGSRKYWTMRSKPP